jgi:hypothetical protein
MFKGLSKTGYKEHRAISQWQVDWARKVLSLLMKCNERTSFTAITMCQTVRLTSKSNPKNIKQVNTFLCKWACKHKGSFKPMRTNYKNRIVSLKRWERVHRQAIVLTAKGNGEVTMVLYCLVTISQWVLVPVMFWGINLSSCIDGKDHVLHSSFISGSLS